MGLTGQQIHQAYRVLYPELMEWKELAMVERFLYNDLAYELNKMLTDEISITAIKCPSCGAMIEDVKHHICR